MIPVQNTKYKSVVIKGVVYEKHWTVRDVFGYDPKVYVPSVVSKSSKHVYREQ